MVIFLLTYGITERASQAFEDCPKLFLATLPTNRIGQPNGIAGVLGCQGCPELAGPKPLDPNTDQPALFILLAKSLSVTVSYMPGFSVTPPGKPLVKD
jgi:hypothetical protein